MNELERLIAAVDRPEPTNKLDTYVYALFAETQRRSKKRSWRNAFIQCVAAACIALLGFYVGRQSARSAPDSIPAMASSAALSPRSESKLVAANVTKVTLGPDQFAGLLVRPDFREGLLGRGPVTILTSTSPD